MPYTSGGDLHFTGGSRPDCFFAKSHCETEISIIRNIEVIVRKERIFVASIEKHNFSVTPFLLVEYEVQVTISSLSRNQFLRILKTFKYSMHPNK